MARLERRLARFSWPKTAELLWIWGIQALDTGRAWLLGPWTPLNRKAGGFLSKIFFGAVVESALEGSAWSQLAALI